MCLRDSTFTASCNRNSILCSSTAEGPTTHLRITQLEITNWNIPPQSQKKHQQPFCSSCRLESEARNGTLPCWDQQHLRLWVLSKPVADHALGEWLPNYKVLATRFPLGKSWKHKHVIFRKTGYYKKFTN